MLLGVLHEFVLSGGVGAGTAAERSSVCVALSTRVDAWSTETAAAEAKNKQGWQLTAKQPASEKKTAE